MQLKLSFEHWVEESMVTDDVAMRRLKSLVEQYVETRKRRHDVISIAKAETAILEVMPNCPLSGKAFDDLIAARAIERGLGVHFDKLDTAGAEIEPPGRFQPDC